MNAQLELAAQNAIAPHVTADDVDDLERLLLGAGDWMKASAILQSCGESVNEDNKRGLRAVAEQSKLIISGQRGYCHLKHVSAEEVHHFYAMMVSQGKKVIARALRVKRAYHALIG